MNERNFCVSSVFNDVFRDNIRAEVEYVNKEIADMNLRESDLVRWTQAYQNKKALQCPTTSFDNKKTWYVNALNSLN